MKSLAFVVLLAVFVGLMGLSDCNRIDYCRRALSCSGVKNIGCGNTGAFGTKCPASKQLIKMTPALQKFILDAHNSKRNTIAAGKLPGFQPAARMATVIWDPDLALLAEYNAKTCVYGHDACRKTVKFTYAGQNIAKQFWTGTTESDESVIDGLIDKWWIEHENATMAQIRSYRPSSLKVIGHFTQMAADKCTAIGCAAVKFLDPLYYNWNTLTLVCDYARTNIFEYPTYVPGKTASKCTSGRNPAYPALCATSEAINPNDETK